MVSCRSVQPVVRGLQGWLHSRRGGADLRRSLYHSSCRCVALAMDLFSVKASVFIATSVDGFIARPNGELDWLPAGGGEEHGYTAFMAAIDAIVIGRNTYDIVLSFDTWPNPDKP